MLTKGLPGNNYLARAAAKDFSMDVGRMGRLQVALGTLPDAGSPVPVKPPA